MVEMSMQDFLKLLGGSPHAKVILTKWDIKGKTTEINFTIVEDKSNEG